MPALDSTIENYFKIHGMAIKSGDFSPNLLENKILKNFCIKGITCCHDNKFFNAMFGEMLLFLAFSSNADAIF